MAEQFHDLMPDYGYDEEEEYHEGDEEEENDEGLEDQEFQAPPQPQAPPAVQGQLANMNQAEMMQRMLAGMQAFNAAIQGQDGAEPAANQDQQVSKKKIFSISNPTSWSLLNVSSSKKIGCVNNGDRYLQDQPAAQQDPLEQLGDGEDPEPVGPPIREVIATKLNHGWENGRYTAKLRQFVQDNPRPANMRNGALRLNKVIENKVPANPRKRDGRLLHAQSMLARSVTPLARLIESVSGAGGTPSELVGFANGAIGLIANANNVLNQVRRDALKHHLAPQFRSVCDPPANPSMSLLFGDNLPDRLKESQTAYNLSNSIGYQPYPNRGGRGRGARGARGRGGRGRGGQQRSQGVMDYWNPMNQMNQMMNQMMGYNQQQSRRGESSLKSCCKSDLGTDCGDNTEVASINDNLFSCRTGLSGQARKEQQHQHQEQLNTQHVQQGTQTQEVSNLEPIELTFWGDDFEAGRVSTCVDKWAKITSDPIVLSYVRGLKLEFIEDLPVQDSPLPEMKFSEQERSFIREELCSLLKKKVIVKAKHETGEYISNIFIVEKSTPGKYRLILNLKRLNKLIEKSHFKMETFLTTLALILPKATMMSFDFSDAYYSLSIFPPHRKFLRFMFEGELYEFCALPNGYTLGPKIFTKIMKVALTHLRTTFGITVSGFLDDNLLVNYEDMLSGYQKGAQAAHELQRLGFTINVPKSVAEVGVTRIEHLGFCMDEGILDREEMPEDFGYY